MNTWQAAVIAVILFLPVASQGQEEKPDNVQATDEIVVVGRSIATSSMQIEVAREMLVDSATVLKDIPGSNVNSNGLITGIAQYRGMYGDRVSVAIDQLGVVSGGPNAMDTPLSYMSPMITEELVVERGIASVSSAPESIGGYINTKLARGDFSDGDLGVSGTLGTRYASNGGVNTSAGRLTLANDRHRVSLVAELDDGDDISTPAGEIRPSRLNRKRYDLSYAFGGEDNELLLFAGKMDTSDTGTPALPMDIRFINSDLYGLQYSTRLTDMVKLESRFAYSDVEHMMDNFTLRQAPMPMRFRQNLAHGSGSQFFLAGVFELQQSELRVGIDGIAADHDSVITNPNVAMFQVNNFNDANRDVLGVFTEWDREIGESNLELGLRYKRVETAAGTVGAMGMPEPMGSRVDILADAFNSATRDKSWSSVDAVAKFRYQSSERTEWLFEVGSKTRAPSYQELYLWLPLQATGGLADGRTYIGDLDLKQERSNEIVVGVTSDIGRLSFSPQVYFKKVDNYVQGTPSTNRLANMVSMMMSGAPALQFSNVDAEIWGTDFAWKFDLNDRWFLDGIASYSRGERTDVSDNLYRLAPLNGSIGLTYAADTWSIKPEVVLYAKQDKVSAYNNEQATPSYELLNIAFSWDPIEALRVEARVDNLLDETYQDHLVGINRAMGSDIPVGERLYGSERTLSAGVIFSF
jgi:iron complex outermembrane receptor protein